MRVPIYEAVEKIRVVTSKKGSPVVKTASLKAYIKRNAYRVGSCVEDVIEELEQEVRLTLWQVYGGEGTDGCVDVKDPELCQVIKRAVDTALQHEYRSKVVTSDSIDISASEWMREQSRVKKYTDKGKTAPAKRPRKQKKARGIYRELHEYDPYEECYGTYDPVFEEIEAGIMVEQALKMMPDNVAKALVLKVDLGYTYDEVAKIMNYSRWSVIKWVRSGKILLAQFLHREEELALQEEDKT